MTSYLNVKKKQGLSKLATLINQAGFDDVKVTVKSKSITLTPREEIDLTAGLADLKSGRFASFKNMDEAISFLANRNKNSKKSLTRKK